MIIDVLVVVVVVVVAVIVVVVAVIVVVVVVVVVVAVVVVVIVVVVVVSTLLLAYKSFPVGCKWAYIPKTSVFILSDGRREASTDHPSIIFFLLLSSSVLLPPILQSIDRSNWSKYGGSTHCGLERTRIET